MITITTEEIENGYSPQYRFVCPECGRVVTFYSIAQTHCAQCGGFFIFAPGDLVRKEEARTKYHADLHSK